jgi:hypothetical protein
MKEIWKDVPGYKGNYQVSSIGRVRNQEKIMKQKETRSGYLTIEFKRNKKRVYKQIHRLVAEAFLDTFNNDLIVDHIDMDKKNNCINNLRMATTQQNAANAHKKLKTSSRFKGVSIEKSRLKKYKANITIDGKTITIGFFGNENEAAIEYDRKAIEYFGEFARTNKMLGLLT